jgi:hypothetical protein
VLAVLTVLGWPRLKSTIDILAVRAARENAFGVFARARSLALQDGGAVIELSALNDRITVYTTSGAIAYELQLTGQRVDLLPDVTSDPVMLRYDAYGLGRMMSRTITLRAGNAVAGLVVSSFGRVRRW